jgi:hypothetical protein
VSGSLLSIPATLSAIAACQNKISRQPLDLYWRSIRQFF